MNGDLQNRQRTAAARVMIAPASRILCALILCLSSLVSHHSVAETSDDVMETFESLLRINSSHAESSIYRSANALAGMFNWRFLAENEYPGDKHPMAVPLSSPGTVTSIGDLVNGRSELALVRADIADLAFQQSPDLEFTGNTKNLRVVSTHRPVILHLVVRKEFNGDSITDLVGKTVGVGPTGDATLFGLQDVFALHGVAVSEMKVVSPMVGESLNRLRNGRLDAVAYFDQAPSHAIQDAVANGEFKLLSMNQAHIEEFCEENPTTYIQPILSSDFYSNSDNVTSIAIGTYLLTHRHVSSLSIEAVLDTLSTTSAASFSEDESKRSRFKQLLTPFVINQQLSPIPLHKGARFLNDIFGDLPSSGAQRQQTGVVSAESGSGDDQ